MRPNEPETRGFASGKLYDGSTVYPGTGNFNCHTQNPSPARITTTSSKQGPGAYGSCGIAPLDRFDNKTAFFFENSPRLKWISTTAPAHLKIPGIIEVKNPNGMFYVGRINVTLKNGTIFQQISKIYGNSIWYNNPEIGKELITSTFEILVCQ